MRGYYIINWGRWRAWLVVGDDVEAIEPPASLGIIITAGVLPLYSCCGSHGPIRIQNLNALK